LYGGCSLTYRGSPSRSAIAIASITIHAGCVEHPTKRTFPARTRSSNAASVSSCGTSANVGRWSWYKSIRSVSRLASERSQDATMCSRRCHCAASPLPVGIPTFVASTMPSRRPLAFSAAPTIRSLSPPAYTSATSIMSMPPSSATSIMRADWSRSVGSPKFMAPRQSGATSSPVVPRERRATVRVLIGARR
jgi:hypothetical protein